ncbi:hypothetical protein BD289DRAFT_196542 [Coniella lustricola]|uniref:Uncharacterized protein n=1 Tax=Coniella lustricola TaxID=2025994 RepID=A0A2T3ACR1_9PEZI|nr:hypothetical protein BD289DRAFT_196542 [Coniella lustricola]
MTCPSQESRLLDTVGFALFDILFVRRKRRNKRASTVSLWRSLEFLGSPTFLTNSDVPYIGSKIIDQNDTLYYNPKGIIMSDAIIATDVIHHGVPSVAMLNAWNGLLTLNDTFVQAANGRSDSCRFGAFLNLAYEFPPRGKFPDSMSFTTGNLT